MRGNGFIFVLLIICAVQYCPGQLLNPTLPQGIIEVTVVNGTPDGHSVVGDLVTVKLIQDQALINTLQGKVNAESKVIFNNITRGVNLMAYISCEHEGAPFYGNPVPFFPEHPDRPGTITVYDVTTDTSGLSAPMHHISISQNGEWLQIEEIMIIRNSALRAIKPEVSAVYNQPVCLEIFLPQGHQGFQALEYFNPEDLVWTPEGFFDPVPVAPGEGQIKFVYFLKIDSDTKDIAKKFSLPTDNCVILVNIPHVEVSGLGVPSTMTMGDGPAVNYYQLSGKQPGDIINIQLAGFPQKEMDLTWIVLAVVFLAVMVVAIGRMKPKKN